MSSTRFTPIRFGNIQLSQVTPGARFRETQSGDVFSVVQLSQAEGEEELPGGKGTQYKILACDCNDPTHPTFDVYAVFTGQGNGLGLAATSADLELVG